MPDKHVFEYALIRLMPRVERGEFLNVGVILYAKSVRFLEVKIHLDEGRVKAFAQELDLDEVKAYLRAWEWICAGDPAGGVIAQQDKASRFRWLTATRSTIIQSSKVHPGLCEQPEQVLEKLFDQYVR